MEETPTSPAASIHRPGYYEVKGRVVCDDPLELPGNPQAVVFSRHRVWECIQETFRDAEGQQQTRTVEQLIQDEVELTDFTIEDLSGALAVYPKGADIDDLVLVPRTQQNTKDPGPHRYHEIRGIPVGQDLYVLGSVQRNGLNGPLAFQENQQEDRPYLLSVRSEEEQTAGHRFYSNLFNFGGLCFGLLATGLLSWGFGYL
jgi:hypothetical protein